MKEIVFCVLGAGIAAGIIGLFFEGDAATGKYIKLVLSLCLVASIIPGSAKLLKEYELPDSLDPAFAGYDLEEIEKRYDEYIIEKARKEMCMELSARIFEKTGITPDEVSIQFSVKEKEDKTIVEVGSVTVYSSELCANEELSEYIYRLTGKQPVLTDGKNVTEVEQ